MKSSTLLGVRLETDDLSAVLEKITNWLSGSDFHHIATVNPEFLVEAQNHKAFKSILNQTDLNVVDGVGITMWGRLLYGHKFNRITGVELAEHICQIAAQKGKSVYFLGGFGVATKAAVAMQKKYPSLIIVGSQDGDPNTLSANLKEARPDILLVAFGAPKQELWIEKFKSQLPRTKLAIGLGGTFDFWAGKAARAPKFFRTLGLEWLWRLITEPRTRAKRIWRAVVVFSGLVLKDHFK